MTEMTGCFSCVTVVGLANYVLSQCFTTDEMKVSHKLNLPSTEFQDFDFWYCVVFLV